MIRGAPREGRAFFYVRGEPFANVHDSLIVGNTSRREDSRADELLAVRCQLGLV